MTRDEALRKAAAYVAAEEERDAVRARRCGYAGCDRPAAHKGMHWRTWDRHRKPDDVLDVEQRELSRDVVAVLKALLK